jgi:hypothetical protein
MFRVYDDDDDNYNNINNIYITIGIIFKTSYTLKTYIINKMD